MPLVRSRYEGSRRLRTDRIPIDRRSWNMARIRSKDTGPEMAVRRLVHSLGYRYRLHVHDLPGCPDLVFPRLRKVIQVFGCYWHPHDRCRFSHQPRSRLEYWIPKLEKNRQRDRESLRRLRQQGWTVLVLRECKIADLEELASTIQAFLG
ncbi:MAG: very short patch repair endonuclease [Acidobacteriales bacterium]|nr:very short patch repair endonuclease [Terriglobales bacterium]